MPHTPPSRQLLHDAEATDHGRAVIWALVLRGADSPGPGRLREGAGLARARLVLAEPEGYVRVFVNQGAPMAALLAQVAGHHPPLAEIRRQAPGSLPKL